MIFGKGLGRIPAVRASCHMTGLSLSTKIAVALKEPVKCPLSHGNLCTVMHLTIYQYLLRLRFCNSDSNIDMPRIQNIQLHPDV